MEGRAKLTGVVVSMASRQPTLSTTREIRVVRGAIIERVERALALSDSVNTLRDLDGDELLPSSDSFIVYRLR